MTDHSAEHAPGVSTRDAPYCRRCGEPLVRGAIGSRQRACCLNATPIAGVCPTHGPVGPHHAVDDPSDAADAE
ncbi:hypothetical protein [Halorubrum laminariae]|uniref:Uncharacterized protein n=1 Tax=Halorubrum laminariae TaxID=1433523 RepID=A0ABD6C1X9_9EURY|nr:hypothetical protein [Halorubrum laminariae]